MAGAAGRRNILRELTPLGDREAGVNFQNAALSLTPTSPDETVIRQRGHQRKSATYNFDAPDPVFFKTPTKSPKKTISQNLTTPIKTPVRSSPRKRVNAYPDKLKGIAELSISCKRVKKAPLQIVKPSIEFENGLKALSHLQLVQLISTAAQISPEMKQAFMDLIPAPDISPLEQRLYGLQRNVYKAYPRNVWGSQDDSFCFVRVRTHLEAFKKECIDSCLQLMESHHWPAIFEYILMAWKLTMGLPDWNNVVQNKIKSLCMKQLAFQFVRALKEANLDKPALAEIIDRLQDLDKDSSVKACLIHATELLEKTA